MSKIPLRDMLSALDKNNYQFYDELTPEQKKEFSPWLAMRYCSSSNGKAAEYSLVATHEIVNKNFSALNKHPKLHWLLLASCGTGKNSTHPWISPPKNMKKSKIRTLIGDMFPQYGDDDIDHFIKINKTSDILSYARDMGYQDDELKGIT